MLSAPLPDATLTLTSANVNALTRKFAEAKQRKGDSTFVTNVLVAPEPAPDHLDLVRGRRKYLPDYSLRPGNFHACSEAERKDIDDGLPLIPAADTRFHADVAAHAARSAKAEENAKTLLDEVMALADHSTLARLAGTPANVAALAAPLVDRPLMFFRALRALFTGGDNAAKVAAVASGLPKMADGSPGSFYAYRGSFVDLWELLDPLPSPGVSQLKGIFFMADRRRIHDTRKRIQ